MMAAALSTYTAGVQQIVVVEPPQSQDTRGVALEEALGRRYLPFSIVLRMTPERQRRLAGLLPFAAEMTPVNGRTAVYVCRGRTCQAPATAIDELEGALAS
jgi:uncharacterized protein YyaL (SSP411 family)